MKEAGNLLLVFNAALYILRKQRHHASENQALGKNSGRKLLLSGWLVKEGSVLIERDPSFVLGVFGTLPSIILDPEALLLHLLSFCLCI